jgi:hypothetical protein
MSLKIHIPLLLCTLFLTACEQKPPQQNPTPAKDPAIPANDLEYFAKSQTDHFEEIDSSGILLFPISASDNDRYDSKSSYKSMPNNSFWNIIFYNGITKTSHLLSPAKILINNYSIGYSSTNNEDKKIKLPFIFYEAIVTDYNKDKLFNSEDPTYLLVSDKEGKNFHQLSPENCSVVSWRFIPSLNAIFLFARKDSDKNARFDDADELTVFEVKPGSGESAKEVFDTAFKEQLKNTFLRDWKKPQ